MYWFGLKTGLKLLINGKIYHSFPFLIIPVSYWRNVEYKMFLETMQIMNGQKILDIGSPKLLSLFLAKRYSVCVYATDINDYFVKTYEYLRDKLNIDKDKLYLMLQDGRDLTFDDNYFDLVYSISVLEHIPNDGDVKCIKQIARVLRPGGFCFLTVPFDIKYSETYKKDNFYWANVSIKQPDGKVFYERRYDEASLQDRLIIPSGLQLEKLFFIGEKILINSNKQVCDYLHPITGPIQPFLSKLIHTKPATDWQKLKKPLCAVIIMKKI